MINHEAADLYFNGKPLGAGVIDDSGNRAEIIGVVESQVFGTFEQHLEPAIYFPMWQDCPPRMTLILKHSKWDRGVAAGLRQKIQNVLGGSSPPIGIITFENQLEQSGLAGLRIAALIGGVSEPQISCSAFSVIRRHFGRDIPVLCATASYDRRDHGHLATIPRMADRPLLPSAAIMLASVIPAQRADHDPPPLLTLTRNPDPATRS